MKLTIEQLDTLLEKEKEAMADAIKRSDFQMILFLPARFAGMTCIINSIKRFKESGEFYFE